MTPKCSMNSQCAGNLTCALGYCVQTCATSKDCSPSTELCVKLPAGNVCRAPEVASTTCHYDSDCTTPLVCGKDLTCRQQCHADLDCPGGTLPAGTAGRQVCTVSMRCVDPMLDKMNYDPMTNDLIPPMTGAAGSSLAGSGGGGAGTTGTAGAAGDMGAAGAGMAGSAGGTTGAAGSNADGGVDSTGAAGAVTDGGGMNSEVAESVDTMAVTPNKSVHQGAAATLTITKTGGGLSNPQIVSFGMLDKSKAVVQSSSTDTSLVIKLNVPHGAALGDQTLVVSTTGGLITLPAIITVSAITAGPMGSDANAGSAASPFRSVKQAMLAADVGDTVHLMDGTYSSTPAAMGGSDETWGYTIPNNLTVTGDSAAGTILDGAGMPGTDAFDAAVALSISNMTLKHFRYGLNVTQPMSVITMGHLVISTCTQYAINVDQAALGSMITLTGADSLIDQPSGYTGIQVNGNSNSTNEKIVINITDATVSGGYYGINLSYTSGTTLNLTNATLKMAGTYNTVVYVYQQNNVIGNSVVIKNSTITGLISMQDKNGSLSITGGTMTQKSSYLLDLGSGGMFSISGTKMMMNDTSNGINFAAPNATMTLTGVTITGGGACIAQSGAGSTAKLRSTELLSPQYYAYYLQAGNLDLGTATDSGGDGLGLPVSPSYYSLYISSATSMVTSAGTYYGDHLDASNALIMGKLPGTSVVMGPATLAPQIYSVAAGSQISFFN
jgi:hypothetical protein